MSKDRRVQCVIAVLKDLSALCAKNDLSELADQLDEVIESANQGMVEGPCTPWQVHYEPGSA